MGWPVGASTQSVAIALLSGVSLGSGLLLLFLGLKLGEASRAVAVSQTNPILVALLAMVVLGETITAPQWAAIALVIAGVGLVSIEGFGRGTAETDPGADRAGGQFHHAGPVVLPGKTGADRPDAVGSLRVAGTGDGAGVRGVTDGRKTGASLFRGLRSGPGLATFVIGEGLLPQLAIMLFIWSFSLGPVSLASAILATRPLFVFVVGTLLSWRTFGMMQESLRPSALAAKGIAIADDRRRNDHAGGSVT